MSGLSLTLTVTLSVVRSKGLLIVKVVHRERGSVLNFQVCRPSSFRVGIVGRSIADQAVCSKW